MIEAEGSLVWSMTFTKSFPSTLGSAFSSFYAVVEDFHQSEQRATSFKASSSWLPLFVFIYQQLVAHNGLKF
jgi:hypothetical protein